jgi:hypothetical protein
VSQFPPHPTDSNSSTTTDVTPVVALKELVSRLHREQNKIQDLLSSLGFALRSFNNLNQFLVHFCLCYLHGPYAISYYDRASRLEANEG